jgi:hypothetical protein
LRRSSADTAQFQREAHVLGDGLVGVERVVWKHHRDVAVLGRHARHVLPPISMLPSSMSSVGQHPQRGALPDRRSDEDDELAVRMSG